MSTLLTSDDRRATVERSLHRAADYTMHLPARVDDFTDFYAGTHHAANVGSLFRPQSPADHLADRSGNPEQIAENPAR